MKTWDETKTWEAMVADELAKQQQGGQRKPAARRQRWFLTLGVTISLAVAVFVAVQLYCNQHQDEAPITPRFYEEITDMWHDLPHKKECPAVTLAWQMVWASKEGQEYLTRRALDYRKRKATNDPVVQKLREKEDPTPSPGCNWRTISSEKTQRRSNR
jgi:hypothetical protein